MSKQYFTYLLKKRKIILIFFFAAYFGIAMSAGLSGWDEPARENIIRTAVQSSAIMSIVLCFLLPCVQLSYVHRKRTVDQFFALPISRAEQITTEFVFMFAVCAGYYVITTAAAWLFLGGCRYISLSASVMAGTGLCALLAFAALLLVNSALYLIGNNIFDGIVVLGAYTCLPVLLEVMYGVFEDIFIAGRNSSYDEIIKYFSPAALGGENIFSVLDGQPADGFGLIMLCGYILLAGYGLYVHYVQRRAERAEQLSDELLAYPAIINIYLVGVMFCLGCAAVGSSPEYILYLMLFVIYIIAQFVYKRKIELKAVYIGVFAAVLALTHVTAWAAWKTKGFGISEKYSLTEGKNLVYIYSVWVDPDTLSEHRKGEDNIYISARLSVPVEKMESYRETVDLLEAYRRRCIADFFETHPYGDIQYGGLEVYNTDSNGNTWSAASYNRYTYTVWTPMTKEDLIRINRAGYVEVTWYDDNGYEHTAPLDDFLNEKGK